VPLIAYYGFPPAGILTATFHNSGDSGTASGVPELSTWLMMLLGFGAAGLMLHHRASHVSAAA
jgi:hypothetical protein